MKFLLIISKAIDAFMLLVGKAVTWLTLLVVIISAGNAIVRKILNDSSNAWLEIQWYLFGAIFLLAAGYTFMKNEHVRVDILNQRFSPKVQMIIELVGVAFFMLPACLLIVYLSIPFVELAYTTGEMSSNTGGLIRWPIKLVIPVGFSLLALAGVSHFIKCLAFLCGKGPNPLEKSRGKSEDSMMDSIAQQAQLEQQQSLKKAD
ncbi:TRAP transporter small permease subunit [Pelistega europaea]|uniref:TRAP transporter small permease protein n=1 Tax=Pelistega europaea TaxID=106147 RepID=A0A7Y4P4M2_9BURK|nr:TRAP transporter small permease subunit [Pelistega europaea]NOL48853.1 TRAP transporter small permease subunit [Pelistega europaea]